MEILLVVAWAITLLCGTGGLLAIFHRLDILKSEVERMRGDIGQVKYDVIRIRTTQLETEGKLTDKLTNELTQLPPAPVRDETAFALGGKQVFRLSREHQGRKEAQ